MNAHRLILGTLKDFLTDKILDDTHDERYRQKVARFLVENRHYRKNEISSDHPLTITVENNTALIKIDFLITLNHTAAMLIKYGPGSLVSRQRSALAMSRVISPYQIPYVVVTNGEEADILNGITGAVCGNGLAAIPMKSELTRYLETYSPKSITEKQLQMEKRIIYAFEIDDSCPCDENICRTGPDHAT